MTEQERSLSEAEELVRRIVGRSEAGGVDEATVQKAAKKIVRALRLVHSKQPQHA